MRPALRTGERPLVLREAHFSEVRADMSAEHQTLTRSLLGGDTAAADTRPVGSFRCIRR